ncbi:MAG: dihydroorotate dehydrogenase-like protein [Hydrogenophilaceae bacterium]|nr:dihydroorotate dehydrogenase-like protein [Hydrogenophilaceae bacterium]
MVDLSTDYLGLKLKNPLVPSASPLSRSLDEARKLEDAGAAALVMYSLFEEALRSEEAMLDRFLLDQTIGHAEASGFMPAPHAYRSSLDHYLEQIHALKSSLEIPVIASLNGVSPSGWIELGAELQQAGAHALELNVYYVAGNIEQTGHDVEQRYLDLLRALRARVDIPIVMKLAPYFSSLPHFVRQVEKAGAQGVSLFNRFFQPDIYLEDLSIVDQLRLSSSEDSLLAMRWIAILYGRTRLSLAATGGVHTADDALKMLLAGADVVHMASALLQHGPSRLAEVLDGIRVWMETNEYESVTQMKGSLSQQHQKDPSVFARESYIRVLDSFSPPDGVWR